MYKHSYRITYRSTARGPTFQHSHDLLFSVLHTNTEPHMHTHPTPVPCRPLCKGALLSKRSGLCTAAPPTVSVLRTAILATDRLKFQNSVQQYCIACYVSCVLSILSTSTQHNSSSIEYIECSFTLHTTPPAVRYTKFCCIRSIYIYVQVKVLIRTAVLRTVQKYSNTAVFRFLLFSEYGACTTGGFMVPRISHQKKTHVTGTSYVLRRILPQTAVVSNKLQTLIGVRSTGPCTPAKTFVRRLPGPISDSRGGWGLVEVVDVVVQSS